MRYKIELAYNGTRYAGWQIQPNAPTIQEAIDKALSTICNQPIETMGCGRTDAGVHAKFFVAHFDGPETLPTDLAHRLNKMLPSDIHIMSTSICKPDFHARFDATLREYEYHIQPKKDPFAPNTFWWTAQVFDLTSMNQCAAMLVGERSFIAFCKGDAPNNNPNCTVFKAYWQSTDRGYVFTIQANRFLRNMVRAIVGTLLEVGMGKMSVSDFQHILVKGNRSDAGASVPAEGLYLTQVTYPDAPTN
jgi:tRNA pseudouridine38-40 synthase